MHGNSQQELGNLRALKELCLESNSFTNDPSSQELRFVNSLTNCRELEVLRIGHDPLNGMLPNSLENLSSFLQTFRTCLSTRKMSHFKLRLKKRISSVVF
jgi:hypothetical protein